jgi:hypothetical protein
MEQRPFDRLCRVFRHLEDRGLLGGGDAILKKPPHRESSPSQDESGKRADLKVGFFVFVLRRMD